MLYRVTKIMEIFREKTGDGGFVLPSPPVRVDYCVLVQFPLNAAFTDTL